MWRKKQLDERVTNLQNKIYREIYYLVMLICIISVAYKFITIEVSMDIVNTEWFIFIVTSVYYATRSSYMGIFTDEVEMHDRTSKLKLSSKNIILGIVFGLVIAVAFGVNSAVNYADNTQQRIYYFVSVFLVSLLIYVPILTGLIGMSYVAAKRKSDQVIRKALEENDSGE